MFSMHLKGASSIVLYSASPNTKTVDYILDKVLIAKGK